MSLNAPGDLAWGGGSTNGTTAILLLRFKELFSLFVTITTALTTPDRGTSKRPAYPQPTQTDPHRLTQTHTDSHLGISLFASNKLQEEAIALLMC